MIQRVCLLYCLVAPGPHNLLPKLFQGRQVRPGVSQARAVHKQHPRGLSCNAGTCRLQTVPKSQEHCFVLAGGDNWGATSNTSFAVPNKDQSKAGLVLEAEASSKV